MSNHVKVRFPCKDAAGENDTETMWALERDDGYEIDNIPFYVEGLALGDVVSAKPDAEGVLWYSELIHPSRHSTIRLLLTNESNVQAVRAELKRMGCASEVSDIPKLVAVDIPPNISYPEVSEFLRKGERDGIFEYQEACLGFL